MLIYNVNIGFFTIIFSIQTNQTETLKEYRVMKKYECSVCGWIYDPAIGDPDGGIKPGTPFESIPDSWVCPVCGVAKDQFKPID